MSAPISQKKGWVVTREVFDRMLAELHPDIEQAGEQSHCFYKTIDADSGCLYSQRRYLSAPPAERSHITKFPKQSNLS
jgi:hypothetical protein